MAHITGLLLGLIRTGRVPLLRRTADPSSRFQSVSGLSRAFNKAHAQSFTPEKVYSNVKTADIFV